MRPKAKITWEIDTSIFKRKRFGDKLVSPKFYSPISNKPSNQWKLVLYPRGNKRENEEYLSLYLRNESSNKIIASYSLSLLSGKAGTPFIFENIKDHFFPPIETRFNSDGFSRFLHYSQLKNFTVDCKLIIKCEVIISIFNGIRFEPTIQNEFKKLQSNVKEVDCTDKLTSEAFSDVTIIAEEKSFHLNKCILMSHSTVFEVMFKNDWKNKNQSVVKINNFNYKVLQELFRFMYTGKVGEVQEIMPDLITCANTYRVDGLKKWCENKMSTDLSVKNAIEYYNSAISNNCKNLELQIVDFMSLHLKDLMDKEEFKNFSLQHPDVWFEITKKHFNEADVIIVE